MVFHCRCFSFSFQQQEKEETKTRTRPSSAQTSSSTQRYLSSTETYYSVASHFDPPSRSPMGTFRNPPVSHPQEKALAFSNLTKKTRNLRIFTFPELKAATINFYDDSVVGEGVYKGVIKSLEYLFHDIQVVVKLARGVLMEKPKEDWVMEVNVLGRVDHPNLVKLIGYDPEDRLLVYEYMSNKSIEYHLSTRSQTPLSWTMRLKVAQDVANGLAYLNDMRVISGDFKSSNVLLDDQWNAKLTDFGVARFGPEKRLGHYSTKVVGTMGYAAPEYIKTGHLSSTSDVWSYGVFLYELITGRLPFDKNRPNNEQDLLEWVEPYIGSERFHLIIDPRLRGNYSLESIQNLSFIANKCLYIHPKSRPKMSEVLEMVNQLQSQPTNPTPPLKSLISVVAIELKKVFLGSTDGKKTLEDTKTEGKRGSDDMQRKESACFSRICCVS